MGDKMFLSDLQNKTLINVVDGKNVGSIVDVRMDADTGNIISLVIEEGKKGFSFSNKNNATEIKWENIKKIGEDVILVNMY